MAPDPRLVNVSQFIQKTHTSVPHQLNPSHTTLPPGFTVCIIGASAGIGEHIAYAYAKAGASNIIIASRTLTDLQTVSDRLKHINPTLTVDIHECEISLAKSVESLAQFISTKHGRLDVLIPNAAYAGPVTTKMDQGNPEWVQQAFDVNAMGTYLAAHYFVPLLLRSPGGAKAFIAIGSFAGCIRRGSIANTGYTVSKMAQIRLVEYLYEQYSEEGLFAVACHPGAVRTKMAEGNTPEDFLPYLVDDVDLCGAVCVWLSARLDTIQWLSGRLISAKWDTEELLSRQQEIVSKDLLKFSLVTE
ncbi:hypothetical protein PV10_00915 [Exophiala mesophila]|uniref:Uncharacterized protein n=1 Tax=Exophiala mesophila TaxID=212818 RepID=A0A0D1ZR96_EXOME|nr:uncharacterized protein PV10_00915 [Exophiala mesophila]KIV97127.1 hypothetical protein PV10_00915 [Exophiala mesophila]